MSRHAAGQVTSLADVTVCAITFLRPTCLTRFLTSLREWYPTVRCLVADDGDDQRTDEICRGAAELVRMPYDSGIPAKRNALLDMVETPLMLVCDDDHVIDEETDIDALSDPVRLRAFDAVGARVMNPNGKDTWGHGLFARYKDFALCLPTSVKAQSDWRGCRVTNFVENFFVARTEAIRRVRWPADQKLYDHIVFWWLAWEAGLRVGYRNDVVVRHRPEMEEPYASLKNRSEKWRPNMLRLMRAHEFVRVKEDDLGRYLAGRPIGEWLKEHAVPLRPARSSVESSQAGGGGA